MADEKGNWAWNHFIGELNPHKKNDSSFYDYDTGNNLYRLKRITNYVAAEARRHTHDGPWNAICLLATKEYYSDGNVGHLSVPSLSTGLEKPIGMIAVIARIPELDSLIPWPSNYGSPADLDEANGMWLSLHARGDRIFRHTITSAGDSPPIPSPGDLIKVDWEDRKSFTGPKYLGIEERGLGFISDRPPSETGEDGEAQDAFAAAGSAVSQNGDY